MENKGKKEFNFDIYYVNRGIWLIKDVEISVLFPILIPLFFQNLFSVLISIMLIVVLTILSKNGFKLEQATRFIQYFFKSNILPIDEYDYKYKKIRTLLLDARKTPTYILEDKINLTGEKKSKKRLRK